MLFSTDNYLEILKPYQKAKKVTLINWNYSMVGEKDNGQIRAYNHCLGLTRGRTKWVAFIDIDEFLFPVQKNYVPEFLQDYEAFGAVCVNWLMFGTSNVDAIPSNSLSIEALTMCNFFYPPNIHVKSIVQPERIRYMLVHNPHLFCGKFFQVTADKIRFSGPFAPSVALDKIRINHYWTRDKKWLEDAKIPRRMRYDPTATAQSIHQEAHILNKEHDTTILKYKDALKERMGY